MIVAAATVPGAPLLLPGLTGRPVPEADKARQAMAGAVATLLDQGAEELIVVGGAPTTMTYLDDALGPEGRLAPGVARRPSEGGRLVLPLSLAVGRSLLAGCAVPWVLQGVGRVASRDHCRGLGARIGARARSTGLLVVADGSARRGEKAPGHLDPGAVRLDTVIADALGSADPCRLLDFDADQCESALVAGRAAWQVMAGACEGERWLAHVLYEDDPFGVAYWVITWTRHALL
ncbi:hypothetical protein [Nonomuraea sp. NPDC002799]